MLLHEYLDHFRKGIEKIERYGYAESLEIREEIRANKQAVLNVKAVLVDNSKFFVKEYISAKYGINRVSYAYQYQDKNGRLIFRYDNASHKPALGFKEHKHSDGGTVTKVLLPDISYIVDEIIGHL